MSVNINDIEDKIISEIKDAVSGEGTVNTCIGDPKFYLMEMQASMMPCYLIRYIGSEPYENLYPGLLHFEVYFIAQPGAVSKTSQRAMYSNMNLVYNKLQNNYLSLDLNYSMYLQSQSFFDYDSNFIIYVQRWDLGVVN
jgi:hypothetical protein